VLLKLLRLITFGLVVSSFATLLSCGGGASSSSPQSLPTSAREIHIFIVGQSIASNCNQHVYGAVEKVYQIDLNGEIQQAKDPFAWADCDQGSMWMPLGRKLIESGLATKVVFMPVAIGATKVEDWQEGGRAFGRLSKALETANRKGISFDFGFWHQGSSDIGTNPSEYLDRLASVVTYVNRNLQIKKWIIAQHSRCNGKYDPAIEAAQREFGNAAQYGRYPGPNTNLLGDEYRFDTCHLNEKGQEEMAILWMESVKAALAK
jgi:hypothetical protein